MLTNYEAAVITGHRMNGSDRQHYRCRAVLVATVIGLLFVGLCALLTSEPSPGPTSGPNETTDAEPMARVTIVREATQVHLEAKAGTADSSNNNQTFTGQGDGKFSFGFVEFDVNADMPGGVPGLGSWPPSASQLDVATARR
jgi:hypothetical protein